MADEHLRRSQRAARGDDPEAKARLLAERVRSGDLGEDRLLLAALLGDPAARLATGVEPDPRRADQGLAAVAAESPRAFVRVALACARAVRPLIERHDPPFVPLVDEFHRATERWLARKSKEVSTSIGSRMFSVLHRWTQARDHPSRVVMFEITVLQFDLLHRAIRVEPRAKTYTTKLVNTLRTRLDAIERAVAPSGWRAEGAFLEMLAPWLLAPGARGPSPTKEALRRLTRSPGRPARGTRCVCTGCRGCHERTRCRIVVQAKERERCNRCWRVFEKDRHGA